MGTTHCTDSHDTESELKQTRRDLAPLAVKWLRAYIECSDEVQEVVREMLEIIADPKVDNDDREMALATFLEALYPASHNGTLGVDLEEVEGLQAEHNPEIAKTVRDMDEEEQNFGDRVRAVLKEKNMKQEELAGDLGIGQPAISMLLTRGARPQRKTVENIARVLGVTPESLWPQL
jgi:hypothetical protein